jgi:hypothetical protein
MSTPPVEQVPVMGFEGQIYVGPRGTTTLAGMILLEDVHSVKYSDKFDEVEINTRKYKGDKTYAKGKHDWGASFTIPVIKPYSAAVALILAAKDSRRMPIAICILDEEGGEGPFGDFEIMGGEMEQNDDGIQEMPIEAKPSGVGRRVEWFTAPKTP